MMEAEVGIMLISQIDNILSDLRKKGYKLRMPDGSLGKPTQSNLAEIMGEKVQTLNLWVTGKTTPPIAKAFRMAQVLGVKVDDLFEYQPEEGEEPAVVQGGLDQ